jgi:hypothetical protein
MALWMKIGWALLLGLMVAALLPRLREVVSHTPRGDRDDWRAALLPLAVVGAFVALLLWLV